MKQNENDYLNKLFSSSSDLSNEVEVEIPEFEPSESLSSRLYGIADVRPERKADVEFDRIRPGHRVLSWPKVSAIAASFFVAIFGFQFYQQQQTLRQLEQAQADLATAMRYLSEANRIAQVQVLDSLNQNIKKAGIEPALEIGRDALAPNFKRKHAKTRTQHHRL